MHQTTEYLLSLIAQPYDNYNAILLEIKEILAEPDRLDAFERTLMEELPLTTARRAYRAAIQTAMGEDNNTIRREWRSPEVFAKRFQKH